MVCYTYLIINPAQGASARLAKRSGPGRQPIQCELMASFCLFHSFSFVFACVRFACAHFILFDIIWIFKINVYLCRVAMTFYDGLMQDVNIIFFSA